MSSNLLNLPSLSVDFLVGSKEDFIDSVVFAFPDGTPCALDGIAFSFDIGAFGATPALSGSTTDGKLVATGGLLAFNVPATAKALLAGKYSIVVTGNDGTHSVDIIVGSFTARGDA